MAARKTTRKKPTRRAMVKTRADTAFKRLNQLERGIIAFRSQLQSDSAGGDRRTTTMSRRRQTKAHAGRPGAFTTKPGEVTRSLKDKGRDSRNRAKSALKRARKKK